MTLQNGDKIKDFTLQNQNEEEVSLSDFEGKKVLLSFHPLAWTSVCRKQMEALEDNYDFFVENDIIPLGISVDPVPTKKAWAEDMGIENLQILSDFWPHGKLAKELDNFVEKLGFSGRFNVLVDRSGKISWVKVYELGEEPDIEEVKDAVKEK